MDDLPNTNQAQPQNFSMIFTSLPNLTFNCQRVQFPGVQGGSLSVPTPFQPIELSGTGFQHDPLVVQMIVNEDFSTYYELASWIKHRTISNSFTGYNEQVASDAGIYSQATIQLYTSSNNPSRSVTFEDIFPISVGGFELDSTIADPNLITFSAVFQYQNFHFSKIV